MKLSATITIARAEYIAFSNLNAELDKLAGFPVKESLLPLVDIKTTSRFSSLLFKVGLKDSIEIECTVELTPEYTREFIDGARPVLTRIVPLVKVINDMSGISKELKSFVNMLSRGFKPTSGVFTTGEHVEVKPLDSEATTH